MTQILFLQKLEEEEDALPHFLAKAKYLNYHMCKESLPSKWRLQTNIKTSKEGPKGNEKLMKNCEKIEFGLKILYK